MLIIRVWHTDPGAARAALYRRVPGVRTRYRLLLATERAHPARATRVHWEARTGGHPVPQQRRHDAAARHMYPLPVLSVLDRLSGGGGI